MKPASEIIKRCGGPKVVAEWLNLDRTAVQRWTYPGAKGSDEQVPLKHWAKLIEKAREAGVEIALADLMPDDLAAVVGEAA